MNYRSLQLQKPGALGRPPHQILIAHTRQRSLVNRAEIASTGKRC